jgi:hypothetical protein
MVAQEEYFHIEQQCLANVALDIMYRIDGYEAPLL